MKNLVNEIVMLYQKLLIPYMKIERDMPFPGQPERRETDGEHAFTLAILAISINERLGLNLDSGKIAQYTLIHDLVEVHAGDLSVKAAEAQHAKKVEREHEALLEIERNFATTFPWIHTCINTYERKKDAESQFVYVVDKLAGAFGWLAGEGVGWSEYYPETKPELYRSVVKRLRNKVASQNNTELLELFDYLHDHLRQQQNTYYKRNK